MNTHLDEEVDMVLRGDLAELLMKVAPDIYRKYITMDKKGQAILYVRLQKALYGLMRAALFFYRKLRKELEDYGFVINLEDPFVSNTWVFWVDHETVVFQFFSQFSIEQQCCSHQAIKRLL